MKRAGFTLVEIIVVMLIVATLAGIILPNLTNTIEQSKAQAALNNLMAIQAAEEKYGEDHGSYYTSGTGGQADLASNLGLSMGADTNFTYQCCAVNGTSCVGDGPFLCSARASDSSATTLFLQQIVPTPIGSCVVVGQNAGVALTALPSGFSVVSPGHSCSVSCSSVHTQYCPSSIQ